MSARSASALDSPSPITAPRSYASKFPPAKTSGTKGKQALDTPQKDITVKLQYLEDDPLYKTTKPVQVTPPFPQSEKTNVRLISGPEEVLHDVRGSKDQFTLDNNGFAYVHAPTTFTDWNSQPAIAKDFLPEMEALLKREVADCDEIVFYDARIRQASDQGVRVQGLSYNPFARQVHVDNTETSVIEKIRSITEMTADYHLSGRARIINIWRPIKHPVYDCGLAIADGGKLQADDVLECNRIRNDNGEYWDTMGVIKYRPGFEWYYMSLQDEPDVLLFKNYDSATDVPAKYCLHTAFDLPPEDVPAHTPTRESIEVRALVFTHPKGVRKPSFVAAAAAAAERSQQLQHPLARTLEQNDLKLVDVEHSITDRLRTDIDEWAEVKDAMLLLRRQEIRRLEAVREALVSDRDAAQQQLEACQASLAQAREQIDIQSAHTDALQKKVGLLEAQLSQGSGSLHWQVNALSRQLLDVRMLHQQQQQQQQQQQSLQVTPQHLQEVELLHQHIARQDVEIQKWKGEAMGLGNEAVSRSWQASVDEAVRREREKDEVVMKALREEIEKLKDVGRVL